MLRYAGGCGAAILQYNNDVFWCHTHSPLLHPVGWSSSVGHKITASQGWFPTEMTYDLRGDLIVD